MLIWGSALVSQRPKIHMFLSLGFVVLRYLHTVSYAYKLQPWRALCWFGALLCSCG